MTESYVRHHNHMIEPCPFCLRYASALTYGNTTQVRCGGCQMCGPSFAGVTPEERRRDYDRAVDAWNDLTRRPVPPGKLEGAADLADRIRKVVDAFDRRPAAQGKPEVQRPRLGAEPTWAWVERRIQDLADAMGRYLTEDIPVDDRYSFGRLEVVVGWAHELEGHLKACWEFSRKRKAQRERETDATP